MSIVHYYSVKLVAIIFVPIGTVIAVMNPTVEGYIVAGCIAAIPPTITGIFNHWKIVNVEHKVDGMNAALVAKNKDTADKLSTSQDKLSHAEGRREGVESNETKGIK